MIGSTVELDDGRGILYPRRLPTFHREPAPTGLEDLIRWLWIPRWSLPEGIVSRQEILPFPASNLVVEPDGVILAGWASNSKYSFLGALRAAAQMVSYELAIGFCMVMVLMVSGSMNISEIVMAQGRGTFADHGINFLSWNWLPLLPALGGGFISRVGQTHRHPFDVVEGESEIVAGHMVEYAGMSFAVFFLAEYANMILVSALAAIMFFGGWQPFFTLGLDIGPQWLWDWFWLFIKTFFLVSLFIWFRASFPRYRYDQIMRLGWKVFIPVTLVWLLVIAVWMQTPFNIWKS